jgi:hypothetical protein
MNSSKLIKLKIAMTILKALFSMFLVSCMTFIKFIFDPLISSLYANNMESKITIMEQCTPLMISVPQKKKTEIEKIQKYITWLSIFKSDITSLKTTIKTAKPIKINESIYQNLTQLQHILITETLSLNDFFYRDVKYLESLNKVNFKKIDLLYKISQQDSSKIILKFNNENYFITYVKNMDKLFDECMDWGNFINTVPEIYWEFNRSIKNEDSKSIDLLLKSTCISDSTLGNNLEGGHQIFIESNKKFQQIIKNLINLSTSTY